MSYQLAKRIERLQASPIRDILEVIDRPGMVSFAGGLPDQDSFPSVRITDVKRSLQYGASQGEDNLRQAIATDLQQKGLDTHKDRILILSGSQQGIDLVAKLLIDEHTEVAVESPTYLAALQVFSLFGASYQPYNIQSLHTSLGRNSPSLLYTIPTFQNPTGYVYSSNDRHSLAGVCDDNDIILFEDDPYCDLMYEDCDRTPISSLMRKSEWIYQSSFSKTICPGLRLGYLTCSDSLYPHLLQLKQAADLHSNRVSQQLVLEILRNPDSKQRIREITQRYKDKRDHFESLLMRHFSDIATWDCPKGGLFFWINLTGKGPIDTRSLLPNAIDARVAFMPGEPFYCDGRMSANALRLNFSHACAEQAERGLATLAQLIRDYR